SSKFLRQSGTAAVGVTFPLLVNTSSTSEFNKRFETRYGSLPDFTAVQTYDAVILLVEAIRKAGLNRARIRDAVRSLSPWQGFSGQIIWDPLGQNARPVRLATVTHACTLELR
ncbi:MAG: ABC transporter substrate-binding protein, partial [bacterium]